jgi:hypothetical protein
VKVPSASSAQGLKEGRNNTFFLILHEMGMDDKPVRRIMGIPQETIYRLLKDVTWFLFSSLIFVLIKKLL